MQKSKEIACRQDALSAVEVGWEQAAFAEFGDRHQAAVLDQIARGRSICLPPGLTSSAQVRAELLAAVAHRAQTDRTAADRRETSEWRQRIQEADDNELWTDYAAPRYFVGPKLMIVRHAAGLTQVDLAKNMRSTQAVISRLERQNDVLLSTFAGYLHAAGASARIVITIGDQDIELDLDEIRKAVPSKAKVR